MTTMATKQQDDPDIHKGAIEGDRPADEQHGQPHGDGRRRERPARTIRSRPRRTQIGANEDESAGVKNLQLVSW